MKQYDLRLEIPGPTAMWTCPDTGDAPVSYPAPTFSAAKGIFESIVWLKAGSANLGSTEGDEHSIAYANA